MTGPIHEFVARERIADMMAEAERHRRSRGDRTDHPRSPLISRVAALLRRRRVQHRRHASQPAAAQDC